MSLKIFSITGLDDWIFSVSGKRNYDTNIIRYRYFTFLLVCYCDKFSPSNNVILQIEKNYTFF